MNWKLILQLSLLGLVMAFGTVSIIPEKIEPACWLVIFFFCAYIIAKKCTEKYFLHGFVLSLFNCVWITVIHTSYYTTYILHHADMSPAQMHMPAPMLTHPRELMLITGPIFGVVSGLFQGLFAFIASKIVKKEMAGVGV